jgi:hypothetical protein
MEKYLLCTLGGFLAGYFIASVTKGANLESSVSGREERV